MLSLNDKTFHRALKTDRLVVMFSAKWAGPCNLARPAFTEVAGRRGNEVKFAEFDIDDNPATPEKYGVRSLPTFILFENGVPAAVKAGAIPAEAIEAILNPPAPAKKKAKPT